MLLFRAHFKKNEYVYYTSCWKGIKFINLLFVRQAVFLFVWLGFFGVFFRGGSLVWFCLCFFLNNNSCNKFNNFDRHAVFSKERKFNTNTSIIYYHKSTNHSKESTNKECTHVIDYCLLAINK